MFIFSHDCRFVLFRFASFRFVLFRFVSFRFVSFRFVSFRFVSFRFVSFRFVSFRFVSLLFFLVRAQALQTSGAYEEAYELCLMAQKVVDESVEKVRKGKAGVDKEGGRAGGREGYWGIVKARRRAMLGRAVAARQ